MNDIDQIARRLKALREPHREHAIKRIEHMLEAIGDHEAEFAALLSTRAFTRRSAQYSSLRYHR